MPVKAYVLGIVLVLQAAGCTAGSTGPSPGALPGDAVVIKQRPVAVAQVAAEPAPGTAAPETQLVTPPEQLPELPLPTTRQEVPVAADPPERAEAPATPSKSNIPPAAKVPPKTAPAAAPPVRTESPRSIVAAPARAEPQGLPSLALATLEQRLKETNAIGVFTKLALKNQVDDLISQFKAHYDGSRKASLPQLRQSFDQLLLKVHELLKNGDPPLADTIMNSRESIWTVLTDPVKFAKL